MNFVDTLKSVELVLLTNEVPLIVGESGIGKTALARKLAKDNGWSLVVIDGNLLKEGEIGGLPIVKDNTTIYAVHSKLKEIDEEVKKGKEVLLFIDEINRCEHTVQQELMNLILNREINGYKLDDSVKIISAMNPSGKYSSIDDYQVVDMDPAQENRFVWLSMEVDYMSWLSWAIDNDIDEDVVNFISTFPEYLHRINENDVRATPRSYERLSKVYKIYKNQKDSISKNVFLNVVRGNVGKVIAEEFMSFIESDYKALISYNDVFSGNFDKDILKGESHTRLYLSAINILRAIESNIKNGSYDDLDKFIEFLGLYPLDLMVGIMKDIRNNYMIVYDKIIENEKFVELYFSSYNSIRGLKELE